MWCQKHLTAGHLHPAEGHDTSFSGASLSEGLCSARRHGDPTTQLLRIKAAAQTERNLGSQEGHPFGTSGDARSCTHRTFRPWWTTQTNARPDVDKGEGGGGKIRSFVGISTPQSFITAANKFCVGDHGRRRYLREIRVVRETIGQSSVDVADHGRQRRRPRSIPYPQRSASPPIRPR